MAKYRKVGSYSTRPKAHAKALREKNKGKQWKIRPSYNVYSKGKTKTRKKR